MKLFTLIIVSNLLLAMSYEPISKKIMTIECDNNCLKAFETQVEYGQSLVLKNDKHNRFVFPDSKNPGLGAFFKEGDSKIDIDYFKGSYKLHSEENYIKAKLIELTTDEYKKKREKNMENTQKTLVKKENQTPSDFYSLIKGTLAVFSYWSPCECCFSLYIDLAKKFPNIKFYVYFSQYYNQFFAPYLSKTIGQLRSHAIAKRCDTEITKISKRILQKTKTDVNKFLSGKINDSSFAVPEILLQSFFDCLYKFSQEGSVPKNLLIQKLSLDPFIENVYHEIGIINEDSFKKMNMY